LTDRQVSRSTGKRGIAPESEVLINSGWNQALVRAIAGAIVLKFTWHDAFLVDVGTSHAIEWKRKSELRHLISRSSRLKRNGQITRQIKF
jgi:hypothetical protein